MTTSTSCPRPRRNARRRARGSRAHRRRAARSRRRSAPLTAAPPRLRGRRPLLAGSRRIRRKRAVQKAMKPRWKRARHPRRRSRPRLAPSTTTSGMRTSVSTPCAQIRSSGRPIETGKLFVQPKTNCNAPATITISESRRSHRRSSTVKSSSDQLGRFPQEQGDRDSDGHCGSRASNGGRLQRPSRASRAPRLARLFRQQHEPRRRGQCIANACCGDMRDAEVPDLR